MHPRLPVLLFLPLAVGACRARLPVDRDVAPSVAAIAKEATPRAAPVLDLADREGTGLLDRERTAILDLRIAPDRLEEVARNRRHGGGSAFLDHLWIGVSKCVPGEDDIGR